MQAAIRADVGANLDGYERPVAAHQGRFGDAHAGRRQLFAERDPRSDELVAPVTEQSASGLVDVGEAAVAIRLEERVGCEIDDCASALASDPVVEQSSPPPKLRRTRA